jgi:hypothetical protein
MLFNGRMVITVAMTVVMQMLCHVERWVLVLAKVMEARPALSPLG